MFKRFRWLLLAVIPAGALLGFLLAAVVTYLMPKKYESIALLQIPANPDSTPVDMRAEVAMVESGDLLEQVIEARDLAKRWNLPKQEAPGVLRKSFSVTRIDGENRLIIRAEHTSREDARDIAAEVTAIYQKSRAAASLRAKETAIGALGKEVLDLQAAVEQGKEALGGYVGGLGKEGRDISEVKSKLDADQKLLAEAMKKRVELAAMIPPEVTIVEKPVVSQIPCSPKVVENLMMGSVGGGVLLPLLVGLLLPLVARK